MTIVSTRPGETKDDLMARRRAIFDQRQNAQRKMISWAEKGFYQKHIDILYEMGYYRNNKSIFDGELKSNEV